MRTKIATETITLITDFYLKQMIKKQLIITYKNLIIIR